MKNQYMKIAHNWLFLLSALLMFLLPSMAMSAGTDFVFDASFKKDVLKVKSHLYGLYPGTGGFYEVRIEANNLEQVVEKTLQVSPEMPTAIDESAGSKFRVSLDKSGDMDISFKYDNSGVDIASTKVRLTVTWGTFPFGPKMADVTQQLFVDDGLSCPPVCGGGF